MENMNWRNFKKKLLENEEFKKEYSKYDLAFEIGEMVTDARVKLGLTQTQLAELAKTQQPSIARLENGTTLPSLSFLENVAKCMGTYLIAPKFAFLDDRGSVEIKENVADIVQWNVNTASPLTMWGSVVSGGINTAAQIQFTPAAGKPYTDSFHQYYKMPSPVTGLKMTSSKEKSKEINVDVTEKQYVYA